MGNQNRIIFIPMKLKDVINESTTKKDIEKLTSYKDLFKFFKDNKSKLNKKYTDDIEGEIGALKYLESDYKRGDADREEVLVAIEEIQDLIKKSLDIKESELKGYLAADVVDDIVKSIGSKFVKGHIENAPNKNYIYLKLTDIKFGNDVVKMLKSKFGIDAKIDKTFGNIPSVSFASKKVISESVNEEKVYIDFLNKAKGFKQDRIKFNSYEDAVKWARKNFDKFSPDMIKYESVVNEGRELKSIQSDLNKTIVAIQSEISSYKATKGTPQEKKHVDNLKKLHPIKKKLESELEMAVSGLYKDAELKIED
jgi:hypothetical protein